MPDCYKPVKQESESLAISIEALYRPKHYHVCHRVPGMHVLATDANSAVQRVDGAPREACGGMHVRAMVSCTVVSSFLVVAMACFFAPLSFSRPVPASPLTIHAGFPPTYLLPARGLRNCVTAFAGLMDLTHQSRALCTPTHSTWLCHHA